MAFTDYKIKNGKHYFYMKDSGPRKHDGWYCYETYMKGLVFKVWSAYMPGAEKKKKVAKKNYAGSYPSALVSTSKGTKTNIKYWQKFLNWWSDGKFFVECGSADGIFGKNTEKWTKNFQYKYKLTQDGICGTKTIKKAKSIGKSEKH